MWANEQGARGNIVSFPSTRTPGATAYQDPDSPTSGFYRSLVVRTAGTTAGNLVTGGVNGTAGDTGVDPASLAVPGNASVAYEGAVLWSDPSTGMVARTLSAGTRVRLVNQTSAYGVSSQNVAYVQGLDDPSIAGFMAVGDLVPRDSAGPVLRSLDLGGGALSPNGDGIADQAVDHRDVHRIGQLDRDGQRARRVPGAAGQRRRLELPARVGPGLDQPVCRRRPLHGHDQRGRCLAEPAAQRVGDDRRRLHGVPAHFARAGRDNHLVLLAKRRRLSRHRRPESRHLRARLAGRVRAERDRARS